MVPKKGKDACLPPLMRRKKGKPKAQAQAQGNDDDSNRDPTEPHNHYDGAHASHESRRSTSYVSWAELMRRSFCLLVLVCPKCGSMMRLASVIVHESTIQRILGHLKLPTAPTPVSGPYTLGFSEMGYDVTDADTPLWIDGSEAQEPFDWQASDLPGADGQRCVGCGWGRWRGRV